ncbi:hypothetical protein [Dendrosporobacter sp. 1207_IL3150]|uniref:hypothetical protein n=1 Tax=Dendrosporobacter sp. 1207_IL3150 TaxID=3084054 RepID=UPI002FD97A28
MKKEVSIYDTPATNYSPAFQSDYAPELPDPQFSSSAYTQNVNKQPKVEASVQSYNDNL